MSRRMPVRLHAQRKSPAATPRWLRPKLTERQRKELCMVHHQNLDAIANGAGEANVLWDWTGGCLTWSRVAQALGKGETQMQQQLELADRVIEQFAATGRIGFPTPEDYQLAVDGVVVMDLLAQEVDLYSAGLAADWSELEINRRALACARLPA